MFYNVSQHFYDVSYGTYFDYGIISHQHGICFKVFIAGSGEEFHQLVSTCVFNICK